jgi:TatD DNase family protein
MLNLIDTHCHLDQIENIDAALEEAKKVGVEAIIAVGTDLKSNIKNLEIAKNTQNIKVFAALGIHPTEIIEEEVEDTLKFIRENILKAKAIGEIGLDYWHKKVKKDKEAKDKQKSVFIAQLQIAKEFNLPVIVHSRGAWQECWELTISQGIEKAVFHWYSGPVDILREIIQQGFLISATPALAYSAQHQEAIKTAPLENILIETDSPVFYQNNEKGFSARPEDVVVSLKLLSELKNIPEAEVKIAATKNAVNFFNILTP